MNKLVLGVLAAFAFSTAAPALAYDLADFTKVETKGKGSKKGDKKGGKGDKGDKKDDKAE